MAVAPSHPLLVPEPGHATLKKYVARLATTAAATFLGARELSGVDPVLASVHSTVRGQMETLLAGNRSAVLLACAQPVVLEALLVAPDTDDERLRALLCALLAATSHGPRPGLDGELRLQGGRIWHDPVRRIVLCFDAPPEVRITDSCVELVCDGDDAPLAVRFIAGQQHPVVDSRLPTDLVRLYRTTGHGFGMVKTFVANVDGAPLPVHRNIESMRELVPLREAIQLLGVALPQWLASFAASTERVQIGGGSEELGSMPRCAALELARHPLETAERLIYAEQGNRIRTVGLATSWADKHGNELVNRLAHAAGLCVTAAFHASLAALAHPRVATAAFQVRRERVLDEARAAHDSVSEHSGEGVGESLVTGMQQLLDHSGRVPAASRPRSTVNRSRRVLLVNIDFDDFVHTHQLGASLLRACHQAGHTVDVVGIESSKHHSLEHELGTEVLPQSVFEGEEHRFARLDHDAIRAAIDSLLERHRYHGVLLNVKAEYLAYLLNHPGSHLQDVPIVAWDRHLHRDWEEVFGDDGPSARNLAAHRVVSHGWLGHGGSPIPGIRRRYQPVDRWFFDMASRPDDGPSAPERPLRIFSGGNSKRDYAGLLEAVAGSAVELRIATTLDLGPLPDNVETLGRIPLHEFRRQLAWSDVVAIPLKWDAGAAGITVITTAMAMGKAVVATGIPAVAGYIDSGVDGLCVRAGDCPADDIEATQPTDLMTLADAVEHLRAYPAVRVGLGLEARRRALSQFSMENLARDLVRTLEGTELPEVDDTPRASRPVIRIVYRKPHWDERRFKGLHQWLVEAGVDAQIHKLSGGESDEAIAELLDAELVIVDEFGTATVLYEVMKRRGLPHPDAFRVTDYHMLGDVVRMTDLLGRTGERRMESRWWPFPTFCAQSIYPSFELLYRRAGIPSSGVDWVPFDGDTLGHSAGPDPLGCSSIFSGGNNERRPDQLLEAVAAMSEPLRHPLTYVGECGDPAPLRAAGIRTIRKLDYDGFYEGIRQSRFVVVNFTVREHCTAGLSVANMASLAARPLVITDAEPTRDNYGLFGHAVLVPPDDPVALREVITRLDRDDDLIAELHQRALRWRQHNGTPQLGAYLLDTLRVWNAPFETVG